MVQARIINERGSSYYGFIAKIPNLRGLQSHCVLLKFLWIRNSTHACMGSAVTRVVVVRSQVELQPSSGFTWTRASKVSHSHGGNRCWLTALLGCRPKYLLMASPAWQCQGGQTSYRLSRFSQGHYPKRTRQKLQDLKKDSLQGHTTSLHPHSSGQSHHGYLQFGGRLKISLLNGRSLRDLGGHISYKLPYMLMPLGRSFIGEEDIYTVSYYFSENIY